MTRRWIGGIFGNTLGSNTSVPNTTGVFSMEQQYYIMQEGGWIIGYGQQGNPATSAEALRAAGITTDGVYYITTPDGGEQAVYCMFTSGSGEGGDYGWMLVARFAADGRTTIRNAITSVRSLTDVTQTGGSAWSADFGTYTTTEVRCIGCIDTSNWMSNRSTDWIYQVPSNQNAIRFFTNQTNYTNTSKTAYGQVTSGPKQGTTCAGARDGRGRWTNSTYASNRISDPATALENYCRPGYFKTPGTDMWYYMGMNDAKWSVHASSDASGQDTNSTALIGTDDGHGPAWYDANTTDVGPDSTRVDFNSQAFFIFIR
jgi:hypothetical protein